MAEKTQEQMIRETHDKTLTLCANFDTFMRDFQEMKDTVYGHNGSPGLKSDMISVKEYIMNQRWLTRAIFIMAATPIAGGAVAGIYYLIRQAH